MNPDMPSTLPGDPLFGEIIGKVASAAFDMVDKEWRGMSEPRWIPVSERLPENYAIVLVAKVADLRGVRDVFEAQYVNEDGGRFETEWTSRRVGDEISHWMPMPKPPEVE